MFESEIKPNQNAQTVKAIKHQDYENNISSSVSIDSNTAN